MVLYLQDPRFSTPRWTEPSPEIDVLSGRDILAKSDKGFKFPFEFLSLPQFTCDQQNFTQGLGQTYQTSDSMRCRRWKKTNDEGFVTVQGCHFWIPVGFVDGMVRQLPHSVVPPNVLRNPGLLLGNDAQ